MASTHAAEYQPDNDWPWSDNYIPPRGKRRAATPQPPVPLRAPTAPLKATSHLSGHAAPRPSVLGGASLNREVIL